VYHVRDIPSEFLDHNLKSFFKEPRFFHPCFTTKWQQLAIYYTGLFLFWHISIYRCVFLNQQISILKFVARDFFVTADAKASARCQVFTRCFAVNSYTGWP